MLVLGIESSCDETSAAVIKDSTNLLSNVVSSSLELHRQFGGVVPEIAARSHLEVIIPLIKQTLSDTNCRLSDIDAISVTTGAGLSGSLLVGVLTAKTLACQLNKPLVACNHVLGHVFANFITKSAVSDLSINNPPVVFPALALIVSGGHSQIAYFEDYYHYRLLGKTTDDAIGEAFDKVAKILGLPYPGGPSISAAALDGDSKKYNLPIAKVDKYNFSFSGLKTAVLRLAQQLIGEDYNFPSYELAKRLNEAQKVDIAASFQAVAIETLCAKLKLAENEFRPKTILLAGGVAANKLLRQTIISRSDCQVMMPDIKLCTDNGAMIACLGSFLYSNKQQLTNPYNLSIQPNLVM